MAESDTELWVFKQGAEAWIDLGFAANDLLLPRRYADLALTADDHPIVQHHEDPDPYSRALYSTIWRSHTEWGAPALMYGSAAPVNGEFLDAIHLALTLGADDALYSAFMYRYYWEGNTNHQPHVMRWEPDQEPPPPADSPAGQPQSARGHRVLERAKPIRWSEPPPHSRTGLPERRHRRQSRSLCASPGSPGPSVRASMLPTAPSLT